MVYQSPINQKISFTSHKAGFQLKSYVSPQEIEIIDEKSQYFREYGKGNRCFCEGESINQSDSHSSKSDKQRSPPQPKSTKGADRKKKHYFLKENPKELEKEPLICKIKQIEWINSYFINHEGLKVHEKFYEKAVFQTNFYKPFQKNINLERGETNEYGIFNYKFLLELDTFESDLEKIVIKKENWFNAGGSVNELNKKFDRYLKHVMSDEPLQSRQADKKGSARRNEEAARRKQMLDRTNQKCFYIQSKKQEKAVDFDKSSMEDSMDKARGHIEDLGEIYIRNRKNSDYMGRAANFKVGNMPENFETKMEIVKPKVNIFEETLKNKEYNIANMNREKIKKSLSHNKERLRANYLESNIHYLLTYYTAPVLRKLTRFLRREFNETVSEEQIKTNESFEFEKQWKNICFPILTPIHTKYREVFEEVEYIPGAAETGGKKILEDDICKLLMENYQLSEVNVNRNKFKFSKGHIVRILEKNDNTITKGYIIDKVKQSRLIPFLFYRYLLYEEKDYRFCSKTIYFQDKNFYDKENRDEIQSETKSLKLLFLFDCLDDARESSLSYNPNLNQGWKKSPIEDFKKLFKEKFQRDLYVHGHIETEDDNVDKQSLLSSSRSLKATREGGQDKNTRRQREKEREITFSLGKTSKLGNSSSQEIKLRYPSEFCLKDLFKIVIEWDNCSSMLVNELVENLITIGRRSKFSSFLTTTEDVFSIEWNMNIVGEIVFSNELAVDLLQGSVIRNEEWYWDSMGFFMDSRGIAFIKFQKEKKLILWKDNNYEKKNRQPELYNEEYNRFFMMSAVFDFLGEMIEKAIMIHKCSDLNGSEKTQENPASLSKITVEKLAT